MTANAEILNDIFEHLHSNPELSWEETETTAWLKSFIESRGVSARTFDDCTGLTAEIGQGHPVVAVRADIDALWQEVNGTFQANHSCGHDAHMTIVLGTFLELLENRDQLQGTVRFIFQPAEEKGTGALKMVEKGVVDDADYLFGMHLRPHQELGSGEFAPAISHGAARLIQGTIRGEDAHGARPHLNTNAVQVGAELVMAINGMHFDPMVPQSMKVTGFQAGGKSANIIPGNAAFTVDARAQTNEVMDSMISKFDRMIRMIADFHEIDITTEIKADMPAAVLNEEAAVVMEAGIQGALGSDACRPAIVTTGGDDFHFYTIKRPQVKATMLAIGCGLSPGLHHPDMTFDRSAIPDAVKVMSCAVMRALEKNN
ncbi:M20 peptidase aminoacylase family protein [Alteribacter natronophilus]|uniref:M20 peptidase aminoacylase family protein n=1 Tax=Alteribacter natronophilus TaxID=2583810 RepID=UPI00110E9C13|nr:M20 peptidase aminoacylase family protein [Alteribacter natronophilus]TMW72896.1 amidohydrolase [Alteribacter natronophilus]